MTKAVLSSRIYIRATELQQVDLFDALTYTIPRYGSGLKPLVVRNCIAVSPEIVSIPSGRVDLIPDDYEIVDKRVSEEVFFPDFGGTLRPSQQEVFDQVDSSCIINAAPSWGKTFCGIAIALKLSKKTLIVTHTLALRTQWESEILKTTGIVAGVIGSGKFDTEPLIVVANIQTLVKRYREVSELFGTIIIDECHHCPANMFTKVVDASKAKYKIGLSGTLERKDGMHVVLTDYFSKTIYRPKRENMLIPTAYRIQLDVPFSDDANMPWAHRVNGLLKHKEFFNTIVTAAATQAARGHKVLVVSDRVFFLEQCQEILSDNSICVTGSVNPEDRDALVAQIFTTKDIIFGTTSIFSEGVNIPPLSCLILTTPISNNSLLTQLIGRIVRIHKGKRDPEVLDFMLQGATAKRQATKRLGTYIKEGYTVKELDINSNKFVI